jgi:hypothetical protein
MIWRRSQATPFWPFPGRARCLSAHNRPFVDGAAISFIGRVEDVSQDQLIIVMPKRFTFEGALDRPSRRILRKFSLVLQRCGLNPDDLVWKCAPPAGTLRFRLTVDAAAEQRLAGIVEQMRQVAGVRDVRCQATPMTP